MKPAGLPRPTENPSLWNLRMSTLMCNRNVWCVNVIKRVERK